jgi:hypothetical protein
MERGKADDDEASKGCEEVSQWLKGASHIQTTGEKEVS